ncbi:hypothetical protein [Streptomyces sp. NPDC007205]|uniref:hypothetical protein n=1 Tax=Streptomyces sp. NPDC007205 TaxID=3154316 RepID=UPI0033D03815
MTQTFHGEWFVQVVSWESAFDQRFVISGSDSADGPYAGTPGVGTQVSGDRWTLTLEWNDNVASGWQPSGVRKSAAYTIQDGLVITLGADDNVEPLRDLDYNDLVVSCTSLDQAINPPASDPPLHFTITEDQLRRPDPRD